MTRTRLILAALPALLLLLVAGSMSIVRSTRILHGPAPAPEDSLRRAVTYLEARLDGARVPSMTLAIDPASGTVELFHGPVLLRRVLTDRIAVSAGIRYAHPDSSIRTLVSERRGLLPPEPVRHVTAPADTAEANRMPTDIPTETAGAYLTISCGNDLVVRLQPSDPSPSQRFAGALFRGAERIATNLRDLVRTTRPEEVTVRLPHGDALAIYRALSEGSTIAVRSGRSSGSSNR